MPDLLPVSMQDFLHRRKSDLRAVQIGVCLHKKDDQRDRSRCGRSFVAIVQIPVAMENITCLHDDFSMSAGRMDAVL